MDLYRRLVILSRGEGLGAASWDGGVALDEFGHHAALGLNTKRERGHIQEQHVFDVTLEHAGLNGGTHGNYLVGVHSLMGLVSSEFFDKLLHGRHTG
ncbi:unannotated protein [freshwater metagenome]|uniref:Unannotated protein n=1 Tax=freshwater metagenome TaxID=449393 RepID=A0A6J7SKU4_9ZZZZ